MGNVFLFSVTRQLSESDAPQPQYSLSELTAAASPDLNHNISYILRIILDQFIEKTMMVLGPDYYFLLRHFKRFFKAYIPALSDFLRQKAFSLLPQIECSSPDPQHETQEKKSPQEVFSPATIISLVVLLVVLTLALFQVKQYYDARKKLLSPPSAEYPMNVRVGSSSRLDVPSGEALPITRPRTPSNSVQVALPK